MYASGIIGDLFFGLMVSLPLYKLFLRKIQELEESLIFSGLEIRASIKKSNLK
jgi:hypothetical protein